MNNTIEFAKMSQDALINFIEQQSKTISRLEAEVQQLKLDNQQLRVENQQLKDALALSKKYRPSRM